MRAETRDQRLETSRIGRQVKVLLWFSLVSCLLSHVSAFATQLPSLFRGVVVADNPLGVRVVSVEEHSQAYLVDLRPEDVIVQINDAAVRSIDEFAVISQTLKGQATKATIRLLRSGQPLDLILHLYSMPILRQWNLAFVPKYEFRFADPKAGREYWARLGRGFEMVGNLELALNAYLNALHNDPAQMDLALKAAELLWKLAQIRLHAKQLPQALMALQQGTTLLERLFDQSLTESQLEMVKAQLEETVKVLRAWSQKENSVNP